jgi:hypothetical protein
VGSHKRKRDPDESGRVKRLYDELEALLRRLPEDRLEAFRDYLNAEIEKEQTNGGNTSDPDSGER